jgi:hypothetical protein
MKQFALATLLLLCSSAYTALAYAAPADTLLSPTPTPAGDPQISVANDQSAIDVAPPYQAKDPTLAWWEFGVSSWTPNNLQVATSNVGNVALNRSAIDIYLNDSAELFGSKVWNAKIGVNWRPLQLSVVNQNDGTGIPITQSSQLVSILLGIEANPTWLHASWVSGYVGLGALPSFIFTGRGGADSGSTYFGLLGDIDAGARFKILKRVQLDVGVMQTFRR